MENEIGIGKLRIDIEISIEKIQADSKKRTTGEKREKTEHKKKSYSPPPFFSCRPFF